MVKITFLNVSFNQGIEFFNTEDNKISIEVQGHSLTGSSGNNIICSAISVTSQAMVVSISKIAEIEQDYVLKDGYLKTEISLLSLEKNKIHDLKIILNVFFIGLFEILKSYPDSIKIDFGSTKK